MCHNLLEPAWRDKPVSIKRNSIDKFAGPSANLKDIRVACICSLGFAGFFVMMSLVTSRLCILDHLRLFVPIELKMTFIAKVIMFILRG